ncbi:MAG: MBL fold metallo-hydrolase [Lentisphaeria bacterium]|nr:MBL fold metallo-hydrolase [Lentisphaeria bacterium]
MSGKFGITILGSGSGGNASVIHGPEGDLLLDAGFSAAELERRMAAREISPRSIRAVLITHDHSDHTKGCRTFADRYRIPAYMTEETVKAGREKDYLPHKAVMISPGTAFELSGVTIEPFILPHDVAGTIGFVFRACERKIGVATDLGHMTMLAKHKLSGCNLLVLEANHDPSMLFASARPLKTKRRIFSPFGHLSNAAAMAALEELLTPECSSLVLAHISSQCNNCKLLEELAEKTLQNLGRKDILLRIAMQDAPLDTFWLAE